MNEMYKVCHNSALDLMLPSPALSRLDGDARVYSRSPPSAHRIFEAASSPPSWPSQQT